MNFLERIPTRWLLTGAALACLALWAAPSSAQVSGDPALGKLLYEDTPTESGNNQLTGSCTSGCHGNVDNRRTRIGGSAFADISIDLAYTRVLNASNNISAMNQFRPPSGLSYEQIGHIAAYIADTPKVTATDIGAGNTLAFAAAASGVAVTHSLAINRAVTATENLRITGIAFAAGATAFTRSNSCPTNTQLTASTRSCTFSVTYTPTSTASESKVLTISLMQGTTAITRTVTLNGSVAGSTPTPTPNPPAAGGGDDSGGGALGWAWLSGLALATAVLARRRRVG